MRRIAVIIAALLAVFSPSAFAMSQPRYVYHTAAVTSSPVTINTQALAQQNDLMILACANQGGATLTPQSITGGWTTPSCSGAPAGTLVVTRTVSASEPGSVGATFTGSANTVCILGYQRNTDGTVPVLDGCAWSASATVASVTTTQANDSLSYISAGSFPLTAFGPFAALMVENQSNFNMSWVYGGQGASGASVTPTLTFGGAGGVGIVTLAFKSQTTTAINFIGVGSEGYNGGSATNVGPTDPSNAVTSSISIAQISELGGGTGVAITPPPDIHLRVQSGSPYNCSGCNVVTIPAAVVAGDLMVARLGDASATITAPAGCGAHSWVSQCTHSTGRWGGYWTKIADSCDLGGAATYTWTGGSGNKDQIFTDWFSATGASLAADGCSINNLSATTTPTPPAITTGTNNDVVQTDLVAITSATTVTVPTANALMFADNASGMGAAWYNQITAGTSTPNAYGAGGGGSQAFLAGTLGIKGAGATSQWTHQASCTAIDPTSNNQVDVYWAQGVTQGANETFIFASNPALSAGRIYNFNNLNTTTPIDVCKTLSNAGGMNNVMAPTITPTTTDDAILRLFPASTSNLKNATNLSWENILAASANGNGPSATFDSIDQAVALTVTNNLDGGVYGSLSLALNDATGQTEAANAITNQVALEVFAPSLPAITGGGSFELIY